MSDTSQQQSTAVTKPSEFMRTLEEYKPQFTAALPSHITVEKFQRVLVTAVNRNPDLAKADRRSLFLAAVQAAQDGLLPDGREAALVKYGNMVQYLPMIAGIRKRMRNTGEVASAEAQIVFEKDKFDYRLGDEPFIEHKPPALSVTDRGKPIGAYAIIRLVNGEVLREVMNIAQLEKVRSVSKAAKNGPWVGWWDEMARKTVLRRCAKAAPSATDMEAVFDRDDEFAALPEPDKAAKPTREQFNGPMIEHEQQSAETDDERQPAETGGAQAQQRVDDTPQEQQTQDGELPPYRVVTFDGEVREFGISEEADVCLVEALKEGAKVKGRTGVEGVWESNAFFISQLREDGPAEAQRVQNIKKVYGGLIDSIEAVVAEARKRTEEEAKPKEATPPVPEPTAPKAQSAPARRRAAAPVTPAATGVAAPQGQPGAAAAVSGTKPVASPFLGGNWIAWTGWFVDQLITLPKDQLEPFLKLYRREMEHIHESRKDDAEAIDLLLEERRTREEG